MRKKKKENIDVNNIGEEFEIHGLQARESPPEFWRNMGSSKNRTKELENQGREIILHKLNETSDNTTLVFIDGLSLINPEPCGTETVKQPLEELVAIKLVSDKSIRTLSIFPIYVL